jgi:hypothetical protein
MTTIIDGTTGVDKVVDGSIGTDDLAASAVTTAKIADANVTQAKLGANVAGNGPAFSVYLSGNQTVANSTATKVTLNQEEFDTAGAFDSTTNYRFQPTVAGYYQFDGNITHASAVTYAMAILYKNGVQYRYGYTQLSAANYTANVSSLIYLNGTTDYVELWGYVVATTPRFEGGTAQTYFSGFLARIA